MKPIVQMPEVRQPSKTEFAANEFATGPAPQLNRMQPPPMQQVPVGARPNLGPGPPMGPPPNALQMKLAMQLQQQAQVQAKKAKNPFAPDEPPAQALDFQYDKSLFQTEALP